MVHASPLQLTWPVACGLLGVCTQRQFRPAVLGEQGADLNVGFDSFVDKAEDGEALFGHLLAAVRKSGYPQHAHFVVRPPLPTPLLPPAHLHALIPNSSLPSSPRRFATT